ncbi:hypothetical protein, partial [Nocardia farcinica]|uniref:hypothetical protein n=1 Tax=Nocardia farcinica TaxID=37329 RepID=UPI0034DB5B74
MVLGLQVTPARPVLMTGLRVMALGLRVMILGPRAAKPGRRVRVRGPHATPAARVMMLSRRAQTGLRVKMHGPW